MDMCWKKLRSILHGVLIFLACNCNAADLPNPRTGGANGKPISMLLLRGHCEMDFGERQPELDKTYQQKLRERGYEIVVASEWQELTPEYLRQFNVVCYLNPGPYLCMNRYLCATQWRGGIHLLTVRKNVELLRKYVENGGGLFIFPALEEAGMTYLSSLEDLFTPYGMSTEAACVRDPQHLFSAGKLGMNSADYSWTENIASHPATEGAKRVYYPSYATRWDDNFTTTPLFLKDPAWTPLVGSMPGTQCMMNLGSIYALNMPWIAWKGKENPAILAARDFGAGRVAVCGVSPFFLFYYTYMKNVSFSEANYGPVDGIAMEKGDGSVKSDLISILDGTYRWLAQPSIKAGLGAYSPDKAIALPPADLSKNSSYFLADRPTAEDPRVTGSVRPMKILVGAHSVYGGGSGAPAEWASAAKAVGYDVVCFTEDLEKLDHAKWAEYVAACRAASDDRIALVPGLDAMSDIDSRFLILGHYAQPRPHILTPDGKRIFWTGHLILGMEGVLPVQARPQWHATVREKGAYLPGAYKHTIGVALATYDANGKPVDDGQSAYKWQLDNGSVPYPVAVHELYSPQQVAAAASVGLQNYYPYDTPERAASAFCAGHGNFGGNPSKYLASAGPQGELSIDDWQKPNWTARLSIRSDAPVTEVLVKDQRGLYRRFTPNSKNATLTWSGDLAVQQWFSVEATDAKGRKAFFSPLRSLPKAAVIRCMDRQNYFTGMRPAAIWSLYPGMGFPPVAKAQISLPGVKLASEATYSYEFLYVGNSYHILDARCGTTMVPGGIKPSADNAQCYNELPIPEYDATIRVITYTTSANLPALREYRPRVTLKKDLVPQGAVWPVFAKITGDKDGVKYMTHDSKTNAYTTASVAKTASVDLAPGSRVSDLLILTPMRLSGNGELGLPATEKTVKAGTLLTASFVLIFPKTENPAGNFAANPPYKITLTQGSPGAATFCYTATAEDGGIAGTVEKPGAGPTENGALPLVVTAVNAKNPVGLWRAGQTIVPYACFEGRALGQLDSTKEGEFYFGNLVTSTNPALDIAFTEPWTADKASMQVCNPTDTEITATISSAKAIRDHLAFSGKVVVPAGGAVELPFKK